MKKNFQKTDCKYNKLLLTLERFDAILNEIKNKRTKTNTFVFYNGKEFLGNII